MCCKPPDHCKSLTFAFSLSQPKRDEDTPSSPLDFLRPAAVANEEVRATHPAVLEGVPHHLLHHLLVPWRREILLLVQLFPAWFSLRTLRVSKFMFASRGCGPTELACCRLSARQRESMSQLASKGILFEVGNMASPCSLPRNPDDPPVLLLG